MKLTLYMAQSVDGFIASLEDDVEWVSDSSWQSYLEQIRLSNAIIMGNRTYQILEDTELSADKLFIVLTRSPESTEKRTEKTEFVEDIGLESLSEIVPLESNILVGGGGKTNTYLFERQLINEVVIDIEETVTLGQGIPLGWTGREKLELLDSKQLGPKTLQLRYKISY